MARMRTDLGLLRPGDDIAVDLKIPVRRRTDLVNDRTRQINRLREQLLEILPALERTLSLTNKGSVLLLTGYQTPAAIRRSGAKRIETWLKNRKVIRRRGGRRPRPPYRARGGGPRGQGFILKTLASPVPVPGYRARSRGGAAGLHIVTARGRRHVHHPAGSVTAGRSFRSGRQRSGPIRHRR